MPFRIESDFPLESDWLPPDAFTQVYVSATEAIDVALEGVQDPAFQEVRVVDVETGVVVWRSTDEAD
ncbi:hypothetical protein BI364_07015 [Acidihalobacter yilgarnensis]|uniref:Uncharacterized protein n=1 Tax=Acidihalobacter yilgarnensis TaxID=2819280 RepID=A0A1D8IMP7_9GAMM|nr:hypothetical protein [Acidihalobacter yilgarnensis]AOU97742.1 hypothetical protein BI364_07015 [Acidihalobacter yilgarnensis]